MTDSKIKQIHRIYSILLSIIIVIAGICLMVSCIDIYNSGKQPFSRESVANAFNKISIPLYLCIFMTILGFILEIFIPTPLDKSKIATSKAMLLENLQNKKDMSQSDIDVITSITIERKKRRLHSISRVVTLIIASIIFLVYATNERNFHQSDINGSMIKAMYILVPCLLVSFIYSLFTVIINEKSMMTEIELLNKLPIKDNNESADDETCSCDKKIAAIRIAFLLIGIGILAYGFATGGTRDVLTKAVNICTECIGLGWLIDEQFFNKNKKIYSFKTKDNSAIQCSII